MKINQKNLKKLAKIIKTTLNVFMAIAIMAGMVISLILVLTFIFPNSALDIAKAKGHLVSLTVSNMLRFKIDPRSYSSLDIKSYLQAILFKSLITLAILVVIIHQVKQILKTVTDNCPFNEKNPGRFSVIAITLMLGAVAINAADAVVVSTIIDILKIPGMSVHFTVNGTMFLLGFLILILAGIFQYGSYLQEEYDTTL